MQDQIKTQAEASVNAAFELATLSFSQVERLTELSLEQAKVNSELTQAQLTSVLEVKDPAAALELLKSQLDTSVKSLAGFAATVYELTQTFQAESAAFAEGHFDHAHDTANKAIHDSLSKAPEGSEAAVTAVKAAVEAGNKALAEARKNAKKTAELAQEGLAKLKEHAPKAAVKAPVRRKARA
ncbi:phasin family protein [Limnohabitans sp.]|uniref:phasin family protein n=1 Tax=Limnohabitans sp. TaxID=1907725 RepID=UPI00333E5B18